MRSKRGIILLEVVVVIGLSLFCISQICTLYTDFIRVKGTALKEYLDIYQAKRLLLSALEKDKYDPRLSSAQRGDKFFKIVDPDTGMWVYKYEK